MEIEFLCWKCKLNFSPLLRMAIYSLEKVKLVLLTTLVQNFGGVIMGLSVFYICFSFLSFPSRWMESAIIPFVRQF